MAHKLDLDAVLAVTGTARSESLDRVLDAAYTCFERQGLAGTTMADIAEEAGVSRVWVHRVTGNREDLVHLVLARDVEQVFAQLAQGLDPTGDRVATFAKAVGIVVMHFVAHPLVRSMLADDPGAVMVGVVDGRFVSAMVDRVAVGMTLVGGLDPEVLVPIAEVVTRLGVSLVVSPRPGESAESIAELIESVFRPVFERTFNQP